MYVLPFELFSLVSVQSNVVWAYFFLNYNICTQRRWKRQKLRYEIFMLLPQWHIERWHDVKYVTKHLSCAISVTNTLINLAFVAGAKGGGRGGRTPATQATINSEMTTPPPPPPSPPGHLSTVFHGTGGYSTTCSTRRLCPPRPGPAPDPGEGYSPTDPLRPL